MHNCSSGQRFVFESEWRRQAADKEPQLACWNCLFRVGIEHRPLVHEVVQSIHFDCRQLDLRSLIEILKNHSCNPISRTTMVRYGPSRTTCRCAMRQTHRTYSSDQRRGLLLTCEKLHYHVRSNELPCDVICDTKDRSSASIAEIVSVSLVTSLVDLVGRAVVHDAFPCLPLTNKVSLVCLLYITI